MGNSFGYGYNGMQWQFSPQFFASPTWGCGFNGAASMGYGVSNWGGSAYSGSWSSSNSPSIMESSSEAEEERKAREKKEAKEKRRAEREAKAAERAEAKAQAETEENYWKLLTDDYAKSLTPSQSLTGTAVSAAGMTALSNPRILAHPINTVKGFKDTKKMFAGVTKKGSKLNKAWKANAPVMEEAYAQMQKLSSRHNSKIGLFRKKIGDKDYKKLKNIMNKALKSGDTKKIADATAKLKNCNVKDGLLPRLWGKIRGKSVPTVTKKLGEKGNIAKESAKILKYGKDMSYLDALKKGGGIKGGLAMAGIEALMSLGKIKAAFSKDSETGMKQVGQTAVKAAGSAIGWTCGEALGVWGAAKLGATIGTAFGPGIGTAIGAVAGVVVGSIGCWAAGKLTHLMVGDDVGDKCIAESKAKDDAGKLELLNNAIARANNNEIKDEKTLEAVQALAAKYQAVA